MEKLVVSWSTGEYDGCYSEHIKCLEYESGEAFLIHLEDKVKEFLKKRKVEREFYERWEENYPKQVSFSHKTQWIQAVEKFVKESPRPHWLVESEIEINGIKFDAEDFVNKEDEIFMPEIQTIDEWFDEKLKEN